MTEIRIHGRGGQGAVLASKLLAAAAFRQGLYAQAFPAFGVERRGAPVTAFTRLDSEPIRLRTLIYRPDHLIVLDPTLLVDPSVAQGLKPGGIVLINSERRSAEFPLFAGFRVFTLPASKIASEAGLGTASSPAANTAMVGAFAKVSGLVSPEAVIAALPDEIPQKLEENEAAIRAAWECVKS